MPPVTTMPTNLPKSNSNFSIDWLVKSDNNKSSTNTNDTNNSDKFKESINTEECLQKEYNLEVSKALRLPPLSIPTPPSDSESSALYTKESPSPRDQHYQYSLNNHMKLDAAIDNSRSPTEPTITSPAFSFNYDKPPMNMSPLPHPLQQHPNLQQQHSQILSAQLQMAAAINYQRQQAAMAAAAAATASSSGHHPQAFNFSQIFSNNFQRTPYQMQHWLSNRYPRMPYGFSGGKFHISVIRF